MVTLPKRPEPTELEIELTNHCNAKCVACPRSELTAPKGYMSTGTFKRIIDQYAPLREEYAINKLQQKRKYPVITFAGMGEPLLHENLFEYIKYAKSHYFYATLFTNASLLNEENRYALAASGIDHIYISFWGINKEEYEKSMGLIYEQTLTNVVALIPLAVEKGIGITIIWVQNEYITSSAEEIKAFWSRYNIEVDDENEPWNRGGYLHDDSKGLKLSYSQSNDYSKDIWCSQLYFTDTICWSGEVVICSCDYYKKNHVMGNLINDSPQKIAQYKENILENKSVFTLCTKCKKPNRNYIFGSEAWDQILDVREQKKYAYK